MQAITEILTRQRDEDVTRLDSENNEKLCEFCGRPRVVMPVGALLLAQPCDCPGAIASRREKQAQVMQRDHEKNRRRMDMLLTRAGLATGRAARQTLASFDDRRMPGAVRMARDYVKSLAVPTAASWLIFTGSVGTGKTHLARAIAREAVLTYEYHVNQINFLRWYQQLKADFDQEKKLIGRACLADLLIIDDVDKQRLTNYSQRKLYEIIDMRYEERRPTLITANRPDLDRFFQTGADVDEFAGAAIADRVDEMAQWVEFAGESYRRRA